MSTSFWRVAVLSLLVGASAAATPIFYGVDLSVGATGHVAGFIETDGTIGSLSAGNLVDWSLEITDGLDTPDTLLGPLSGNSSFVSVDQTDQSATSAAILFDFSASDSGFFFFESNSNNDFVCFGPGGAGAFMAICSFGEASNVEGISLNHNQQNTPLTGTQVVASSSSSLPEPASVILVAAGLSIGVVRRLRRGQPPSGS
jgi:hypothetical protein